MWDHRTRKSVLDDTKEMDPVSVRAYLEEKGVPMATYRYWRKLAKEGLVPGKPGQAPSRVREIVREELREELQHHLEEYHKGKRRFVIGAEKR